MARFSPSTSNSRWRPLATSNDDHSSEDDAVTSDIQWPNGQRGRRPSPAAADQTSRPPPRKGPDGHSRADGWARMALRRAWIVPPRPALRHPELDSAAGRPRPAQGDGPRLRAWCTSRNAPARATAVIRTAGWTASSATRSRGSETGWSPRSRAETCWRSSCRSGTGRRRRRGRCASGSTLYCNGQWQ